MNYYDLLIYRSTHQSLFVKDQSFTFTQLVAATYKIKWRGKKKPTFSTSDTLPTGFSLSSDGIVSYDGSVIQSGVTNWTVTATDGVDTVTASMTMTLNEATVKIVDGQTLSFNIGVASQKQIKYAADGTPTFSVTSGTLPSGMTMTTGGLIEYDGTGSIKVSTSVEVTATLPTSASDTATVGVKLISIPQDYVFYAPLTNASATSSDTGQTLTYNGTVSSDTIDGIQALHLVSGRVVVDDTTVIPTGRNAFTQSIWLYLPNWQKCGVFTHGVTSAHNSIHIQCKDAQFKLDGGGWFLDYTITTSLSISQWHHIVQMYDGTAFSAYLDGVLMATSTNTDVDVKAGKIAIGSQTNGSESSRNIYVSHARLYDRVLDATEVQALYSELSPAPAEQTTSTGE